MESIVATCIGESHGKRLCRIGMGAISIAVGDDFYVMFAVAVPQARSGDLNMLATLDFPRCTYNLTSPGARGHLRILATVSRRPTPSVPGLARPNALIGKIVDTASSTSARASSNQRLAFFLEAGVPLADA